MTAAKTRFEKVSLEDLKKILPEQVMDGNHQRSDKQKDKKNGSRAVKTNKQKSKA